MAHTFAELVEKQQVANEARDKVDELRHQYGPPAAAEQTEQQAETYETALRAWRDLERELHTAVADFAREHSLALHEVEGQVRAEASTGGPPQAP
ncbi:hypothetical protein [Streptomyces odontomachi]|uniref:hypothetical protein n=1 Tax=Streptomyces odontomachi TaxID=2944940 RepID=UPI00210B58FE|nr:hypothetical protein [Streptomyces sp. ODS25]